MSCSERLVKLVEFWQGLENARPARPAGASVIEQLAKKSIGIPFLLLATFAPSGSSTMDRYIKAQMSFEETTEVIKVQKWIFVIEKERINDTAYELEKQIENEDI